MKKTIVCYGDSNTHGYDSSTGGRFDDSKRYTCLLQEFLGSDYLVREEGMSGRTTVFDDPLFEGLNGLTSVFTCLMTHEPVDLLVIMLGTNDTKERFGANAENIAKGLERLAKKAMSVSDAWSNGRPNILLVVPATIEKGYEVTFVANEMGRGCSEKSKQLSYYFKNTADLTGCHFLDAGQIEGIKVHPNDCMHLDENSHRLLAIKLSQLIPSLL